MTANESPPRAADVLPHFRRVCEAYQMPPRAYHNLTHISECLALYADAAHLATNPDEVEFAIWLHDCVYEAHRADNEERSASVAVEIAQSLGLPELGLQRVHRLILATRHKQPPTDRDEAVLMDVDLSILAAPPDRYDAYAAAIRAEYAHVDDTTYRAGRADFLRALVKRPAIYHTPLLAERFDASARTNLRREIIRLTGT